jgi:hypothetical protein
MTTAIGYDARSFKDTAYTGALSVIQTIINYFFIITGTFISLILVLSLVLLIVLLLIS